MDARHPVLEVHAVHVNVRVPEQMQVPRVVQVHVRQHNRLDLLRTGPGQRKLLRKALPIVGEVREGLPQPLGPVTPHRIRVAARVKEYLPLRMVYQERIDRYPYPVQRWSRVLGRARYRHRHHPVLVAFEPAVVKYANSHQLLLFAFSGHGSLDAPPPRQARLCHPPLAPL